MQHPHCILRSMPIRPSLGRMLKIPSSERKKITRWKHELSCMGFQKIRNSLIRQSVATIFMLKNRENKPLDAPISLCRNLRTYETLSEISKNDIFSFFVLIRKMKHQWIEQPNRHKFSKA